MLRMSAPKFALALAYCEGTLECVYCESTSARAYY